MVDWRRLLPAVLAVMLLSGLAPAEDEEIRQRRRKIEVRFASEYIKVAKEARRNRGEDLTRRAYVRAEDLDPGNDDVIDFSLEVKSNPSKPQRRKLEKLERKFAELMTAEAQARLELARWLDDMVFVEESVEETALALRLAPGPVSFDEQGVLSEPKLGNLPTSLSISVFDQYEVVAGKLVKVSDIPEVVPWSEGWKLTTEHFQIETNVSGRLCRTVGRALEAAREIYAEETGFDVTKRISVYILRTRKAYEGYWEKLGREKPHPTNKGKCLGDHCAIDGTQSKEQVISTAIHEVAHGYFNLGHEQATGKEHVAMPTWYAEGLATYCAGYGKGSLSFDRGVVLPRIARDAPLARFQTLVRLHEVRDIEELMRWERGDSLFYYQACAFYWFFKETPDESLKALYRGAVKAMVDAGLTADDHVERGASIFRERMGGDLAMVQEAFLAWVMSLEFEEDQQ
jgi:hypothetical protein